MEITYKSIGIVHSPFKKPKGTPIQPRAARGIEGTVEIFPEYEKGLKDIEGFSHIILICHFHLSKTFPLKVQPFIDNNLRGLFATRAPSRPNPIGISIVRLVKVKSNMFYIRDIDIVDGTPLLDIKPYIPEFSSEDIIKKGWLENNIVKLSDSKDDGRFIK